jgi:hypothetical protein
VCNKYLAKDGEEANKRATLKTTIATAAAVVVVMVIWKYKKRRLMKIVDN